MAERTTIARPYAAAVFQTAAANNALANWLEMLRLAKMVTADSTVANLIGNPKVSSAKAAELILSVGGSEFSDAMKRFVKVLAENKRLSFISEIFDIFQSLKDQAEKSVEAHVSSAKALSDAEKASLEKALGQRLGKTVNVHSRVDDSLIGGAIIRAGDLVIDGSVRGKVSRLISALNH